MDNRLSNSKTLKLIDKWNILTKILINWYLLYKKGYNLKRKTLREIHLGGYRIKEILT